MITEKLSEDLKSFKSAPFLFIGSGFSRRHIKLEDWKTLLKKFCIDNNQDFSYYNSKANSKLELVAELMAVDFHELWYKDDRFKENRLIASKTDFINVIEDPLKYEISNYIKLKTIDCDYELKDELELLKNIAIDGIITTNWDLLLENLFPDFKVFVGQSDLLSSLSLGVGEIYKIHGTANYPPSLVLTQNDYNNFNIKNPYLAAKLLTIFLEHPIFFIGYSLSDENIKEILKQISFCLSENGVKNIENSLFFIEPIFDNSDDTFEKTVISINDKDKNLSISLPITLIKAKDYSKIYLALAKYKRKLNVKQLRLIKENIYEIVRDNDPKGRVSLIDPNSDINEVDFVMGVALKDNLTNLGYTLPDIHEINEDILFDNKKYDYEKIVSLTLNKVHHNFPKYKYLRLGNFFDETINLIKEPPKKVLNNLKKSILESRTTGKFYDYCKKDKIVYNYSYNCDLLMAHIQKNGAKTIDLEKLRNFLKIKFQDDVIKNESNFKKMVVIYDWLKYYEIFKS
ncbi:MAG: SIR2 family protein [Fusobacteriaceae bacterium]|nr:SIR2 family protein [Fusobacteriaceae bacterium]